MNKNTPKAQPLIWPVYLFRPIPKFHKPGYTLYRYADGSWRPDDGEPDLAFVRGQICLYISLPYQRNIVLSWLSGHWTGLHIDHPRGNPWHYALRDGASVWGGDWGRDRHPNTLAGRSGMDFICREHGAASGSHIEWKPGDPHIAAGLVAERDTGAVVRLPESAVCMYCGAAPAEVTGDE